MVVKEIKEHIMSNNKVSIIIMIMCMHVQNIKKKRNKIRHLNTRLAAFLQLTEHDFGTSGFLIRSFV